MEGKSLIYIILGLSVFFYSCKKEQKELPVPKEKLELILTDVHVAEAALQYMADHKLDSLKEVYYSQIFEIHGISEELFQECLEVLENDPRETSILYKKMLEDLEKRKKALTSKPSGVTKKREWSQDSLSRE